MIRATFAGLILGFVLILARGGLRPATAEAPTVDSRLTAIEGRLLKVEQWIAQQARGDDLRFPVPLPSIRRTAMIAAAEALEDTLRTGDSSGWRSKVDPLYQGVLSDLGLALYLNGRDTTAQLIAFRRSLGKDVTEETKSIAERIEALRAGDVEGFKNEPK